jgi:hypothetical protein
MGLTKKYNKTVKNMLTVKLQKIYLKKQMNLLKNGTEVDIRKFKVAA